MTMVISGDGWLCSVEPYNQDMRQAFCRIPLQAGVIFSAKDLSGLSLLFYRSREHYQMSSTWSRHQIWGTLVASRHSRSLI